MKLSAAVVISVLVGVSCIATKISFERRLGSHLKPADKINLQVTEASFYGHSLKHYSLGFNNLIADLLWIDLMQRAAYEKVSSDKVSWEYAQLDALTTLDPHFLKAYSFGAVFLSVFRQDRLGAKLILEKWVEQQPNYWHNQYILGYHLFYEMNDYAAAYPHILKAASLPGAPPWLSSLGVRILSETGALLSSLKLSLDLFATLEDPEVKKRLIVQIRSIRYAIQKASLEKALVLYRNQYHHEPTNLAALQPLESGDSRELASIAGEGELNEEMQSILSERFPFQYEPESRSIISQKTMKELEIEEVGIHRHPAKKQGT